MRLKANGSMRSGATWPIVLEHKQGSFEGTGTQALRAPEVLADGSVNGSMELRDIPGLLWFLLLGQREQSEQPVYDWMETILEGAFL